MPDQPDSPLLDQRLLPATVQALFHQGGDGIYLMDTAGRFLEVNQTLVDRLGYDRAELLSMGFATTVDEKNSALVNDQFSRALSGETVRYLATGVRRDGTEFRADVINIPLVVDGEVTAVLGIAHDIDELEAAQRDREMMTLLFESTLNEISDGLFFLDKDFRFTYVNPRAEQIAQRTKEELIGASLWEDFPLMAGAELGIGYRKALAEQVKVVVRDYYEPYDLTVEATAYPTPTGLAIYVRDVSNELKSTRVLAESEQRIASLAALLDSARDAIAVRGLDNSIRYWNRAATDLYGWSLEEVAGKSSRELLYRDPAAFDAALAATLDKGEWAGDIEQVSRDGRVILADARWSLVRDDDGAPEAIFAVNTDVTIRRSNEERVLRAQRMESLGTLAGGIAHDLNNVLTPLLMSVQMLAEDETDADKRASLAVIETSAKRGAAMMRQILEYARGVEGRRIEVDVARLVADTEAFCRETLPKTIAVSSQVDEGAWHAVGDPTQLLQVMVNLVTNARDAMRAGGELLMSVDNVVVADAFAMRVPAAGSFVRIRVEDNGTGMQPEVVERAFEPFFSTKGVGEGTGLGLASSASIVQSHGGTIQVYSEVGAGTRFEIMIPAVASAAAATPQSAAGVAAPRGNGELVLVVDDEAEIRQTARTALESHGYRVAVTANGREALNYLSRFPGDVSLIVSDISMPVMDGSELLARLNRDQPELPMLLTSGLSFSAPALTDGREFLPKPYSAQQLRAAVARLLA